MILQVLAQQTGVTNNVFIAIGGIGTAIAAFFLQDMHKMLRKALNDITDLKIAARDHEVRIETLEDKLKAFRR